MRPAPFIKIASALTFLHAVLHTIGGVLGKPAAGIQATTLAVMKANQFPVMGFTRSYSSFYTGMGLAVSIMLMAEAVVFWQLASLSKAEAPSLRPILATFLVGYLALALNSSWYFFLPPVITEVLIAGCLGAAIVTARPRASVASFPTGRATSAG